MSPAAVRFYLLPKIHKAGNSGRPIVSGIGAVTELISLFLDTVINPIPPSFLSHVKATNHYWSDIVELYVPMVHSWFIYSFVSNTLLAKRHYRGDWLQNETEVLQNAALAVPNYTILANRFYSKNKHGNSEIKNRQRKEKREGEHCAETMQCQKIQNFGDPTYT